MRRPLALLLLCCLAASVAAAQTRLKRARPSIPPPAAAPAAPKYAAGLSPLSMPVLLPDFWGSYAIWGASGADARGHVWFGLSSNDHDIGSAHLYEYDPVADTIADRGDVVGQLTRLGLRKRGDKQMKIHSRIVTGADGLLYFASMDETGERGDGSRLPTWGGHLWRLSAKGIWQHIAATPEALIAVASGGRYVYALGYFGHVLYQYDTTTRKIRSLAVGSAAGHVSRNFIADHRGHVYVPRAVSGIGGAPPTASLVEIAPDLTEVSSHPLDEYFERGLNDSHGMVAFHGGSENEWFFTTGKGRLYRIAVDAGGTTNVSDQGWFHPAGSRYVAAMFRDSATGALYGVAGPNNHGGRRFDWVTRPASGMVTVAPILYRGLPEFPAGALLYGSTTRDREGRFYAVGALGGKPLALRLSAPLSE